VSSEKIGFPPFVETPLFGASYVLEGLLIYITLYRAVHIRCSYRIKKWNQVAIVWNALVSSG